MSGWPSLVAWWLPAEVVTFWDPHLEWRAPVRIIDLVITL